MTVRDAFYFLAGIPFLAGAKFKSMLHGYSTPRPVSPLDRARNFQQDVDNARFLQRRLTQYGVQSLQNLRALELGPGQSPGVARDFYSRGLASYTTFDMFQLMSEKSILELHQDCPGYYHNLIDERFDCAALYPRKFDLILSMAAFEHFDDPCETIRQLSKVAAPGCVLCIDVDFKTHSRWIAQRDPNNIYRYPQWLYKLFAFPGQPNRVRPWKMECMLHQCGWKDIKVFPSEQDTRVNKLNERFRQDYDRMDILSATICARWP